MEKSDVAQPIPIVLNGSNYTHWVEAICSFLKGRKLWKYVISDIKSPTKAKDETDKKFTDGLDEWERKNNQIITWFRNTSTPSIHLQFGCFETTKEV